MTLIIKAIELAIVILFAHMFSDYFLQTDYLAGNKGKDNYILLAHCILYGLGIGMIFGIFGIRLTAIDLALISAIHYPVDYLKARGVTPKLIGDKNALILDQVIHYITLLIFIL